MSARALDRRQMLASAGAALVSTVQPAWAEPQSDLSFLVIGDWGRKGGRAQQAVADRMKLEPNRFVVTVGDNFYNFGVRGPEDSHWRKSFDDVYDRQALPLWFPALGNHDHAGGRPGAQVSYNRNPRWQMADHQYVHEHRSSAGLVRLIILDTSPLADPEKYRLKPDDFTRRWNWIDTELARPADYKLVFGHHFLRSSGKSGRDYGHFRETLAPRLVNAGVQAYVAGHDHHMEYLQEGPVAYIISGAGAENDGFGRTRATGHQLGEQLKSPGFTRFTVTPEGLIVTFISLEEPTISVPIPKRAAAWPSI